MVQAASDEYDRLHKSGRTYLHLLEDIAEAAGRVDDLVPELDLDNQDAAPDLRRAFADLRRALERLESTGGRRPGPT